MKAILAVAASAILLNTSILAAEEQRVWGSIGNQLDVSSAEVQARYMGEPMFWGLQPVLGVSFAANDSAWIGVGSAYTWRAASEGFFVRLTSMAGVHSRGSGRNLGGPIQFRTSLDVGLASTGGFEFGVGVDHRSSAGIYKPNPGLNTAYLFATMPIR
jgi:opacity protein-like surface antigen